ncbi:uncharacterized protein EAF01_007585 [Botrytis porri]|uniref:Uncharacterized protein n=1 Tax=Botrytis porri TaxID=87229 RepID=A0A4Z1L3R5_9HELO|nr:uncharacterized protein EAF01_007585 [Botrytis porri]KAF7900283.1 hypothetical protein EAF01_007585 [Botrytis porri]TGO91464.1 hypothetical protein BPOR_0027g00170 [Botrytis porri]
MGLLQENQDPPSTSPQVSNREKLASGYIRPHSTDSVRTTTSSPPTIQPVDLVTYTLSFQSTKAHHGFDANKYTLSDDISQYSSTLSLQSVDKKAFRERTEKWIEGVERGEWETRRSEGLGVGKGRVDEGVSHSKRRKRYREGRGMVGDDDDDVRGKKSRVGEREDGDSGMCKGREVCERGIMKDLGRRSFCEERE